MASSKKVIPALAQGAQIKRKLHSHLRSLGFTRLDAGALDPHLSDKECYRAYHSAHREEKLQINRGFLKKALPKLGGYFAEGKDLVPADISPRIEVVLSGTWQSDLFRLATLTWSIPVSNGYGRRMRFLVWDDSCEKLMGIIALTDPVFNLAVRDNHIGWSSDGRKQRLTYMMDAHTLGAIPPYNKLLGGKLVSCLIRTTDVRDLFRAKYFGSVGLISGEEKKPKLIAVTTSSSLGRSSVYNRLKLDGVQYFKRIGYTSGFGHFQIPQDLFEDMRSYLDTTGHPYANGHMFGSGPNWRMRTIKECLSQLGLNQALLKHNLKREVFICPLASNYKQILTGERKNAKWTNLLSVEDVGRLAIERWIIPRSESRPDWRFWSQRDLVQTILTGHEPSQLKLVANG